MVYLRSIFFGKPKSRFYVVLDAGTYSIRSLGIEHDGGVIGLKKIITLLSPKKNGDIVQKIGARLRDILFRYIKGRRRIPDTVLIGLASRLTLNFLEIAREKRPFKTKSITRAEIDGLVDRFIANRKEVIKNSEKFILAHAEAVHLKVDGYDVGLDKMKAVYGSEVELSVALNYIREDFWKEIDALKRMLGGINIEIKSSHIAVQSIISRAHPQDDFLLMKIGGKIIEVSGIKEGVLVWTETLAAGGEYITSRIAESLNISFSRAEDIKRQYETLLLPESISRPARRVVEESLREWLGWLNELLHQKQFLLPEKIYLYGGGARLPALKRALEEKEWAGDLIYKETVQVNILTAEDIIKTTLANQPLKGPEDVDLAALTMSLVFSKS